MTEVEQLRYYSAASPDPEALGHIYVAPELFEDPAEIAEKRQPGSFRSIGGRCVAAAVGTAFATAALSGLLSHEQAVAATPDDSHDISDGAASGRNSLISIYGPQAGQDTGSANRVFGINPSKDEKETAYRIGTYNILGTFTYGQYVNRARWASTVIKNNELDAVVLEEVTPEQRREFLKPGNLGKQYNFFPKVQWKDKNSRVYIAFRKDRWTKIGDNVVKYPFYGDRGLSRGGEAPFVRLRDKVTGKVANILGFHSVAWNTDPGSDQWGGQKREETAKILHAYGERQEALHPDSVTYIAGDANGTNNLRNHPDKLTPKPKDIALNGDRNRLGYCIMTTEKVIQDTLDRVRNVIGHCKDKSRTYVRSFTVDWVFSSDGAKIFRWTKANSKLASRASDHDLVFVEASQVQNETE